MNRFPGTRMQVALCAALLSAAAGAEASDTTFEIVPLVGYRIGGQVHDESVDENRDVESGMSYGLALNLTKGADTQWELTYSRQSSRIEALVGAAEPGSVDVDVEYLQFGGTFFYEQEQEQEHEHFDPYVVGGLGLTHFKPSGSGLEDLYEPSLNVGIGMRIPLAKKVALRLEGRGYFTFINTTGSIFCKSDETGAACSIHAHSSGLWQIEALFGIAFAL